MGGRFGVEAMGGHGRSWDVRLCAGSEAIRSHQKPSEAVGSHRKPSEAIGSHRKPSEALGSTRKHSDAIGSTRKRSEALGCVEKRAEAPACRLKPSEALGSHRGPSEAIGGNLGHLQRVREVVDGIRVRGVDGRDGARQALGGEHPAGHAAAGTRTESHGTRSAVQGGRARRPCKAAVHGGCGASRGGARTRRPQHPPSSRGRTAAVVADRSCRDRARRAT